MTWKPNVTVAAVIEQNGRFLVVEEEADGRVVYNQPAGHLEAGESLLDAAIRETLEETAWQFEPDGIIGLYRWPMAPDKTFLRVCFRGRCVDRDAQRPLDTGIRRALWLTREELANKAEQLRSPMVMSCIDDYLANRCFPLEILREIEST